MTNYTAEQIKKLADDYAISFLSRDGVSERQKELYYSIDEAYREAKQAVRRMRSEVFNGAISSIEDVLSGKDTGTGEAFEPWAGTRMKLIKLIRAARDIAESWETKPYPGSAFYQLDAALALIDAAPAPPSVSDDDGMCNPENPERRCVCREEFGYRVCEPRGGK